MRTLICGAGAVAADLLRQLGDGWEVALMDRSRAALDRTASLVPEVAATLEEDASSPVALDRAEVGGFDFVLALTRQDDVNEAVATHALSRGVPHVLALATSAEAARRMGEAGVHVIRASNLVASRVFHYLQDPRIRILPLTLGPATLMEVNASEHFRVVGKSATYFNTADSRLVGIFRREKLLFPGQVTRIRAGDRLVVLGKPEVFDAVCGVLECGQPHFPLAYGPTIRVALGREDGSRLPPILDEGRYLARNTHVRGATVLNPNPELDLSAYLETWPTNTQAEVVPTESGPLRSVLARSSGEACGLVLIPPVRDTLPRWLLRSTYVELARALDCPLLLGRGTVPYERILVPFNGSAMSELAVEIAVDLASQIDAQVDVGLVEQPGVVTGDEENWVESTLAQVRELARIHKRTFGEVVRRGNPVRELAAVSEDYDLLVVGTTNVARGVLQPNVGESLARRARCSVLLVAS